jgi:hypothetical protein
VREDIQVRSLGCVLRGGELRGGELGTVVESSNRGMAGGAGISGFIKLDDSRWVALGASISLAIEPTDSATSSASGGDSISTI